MSIKPPSKTLVSVVEPSPSRLLCLRTLRRSTRVCRIVGANFSRLKSFAASTVGWTTRVCAGVLSTIVPSQAIPRPVNPLCAHFRTETTLLGSWLARQSSGSEIYGVSGADHRWPA
jgi:hypothetical protein